MVKQKEVASFFVCFCFGGELRRDVLPLHFAMRSNIEGVFKLHSVLSFALFMFAECCVFITIRRSLPRPFSPIAFWLNLLIVF